MRHVNHKHYDIVQMACMMLPYMGISPALRTQARKRARTLASSRHFLALSFWMDQSSLVVDPVLLSSVDVTRPVLRRFELGMSEFVRSDTFEDENRDPTTGKPRRLSLSVQKRPRNMILIL